MENVLVRPRDGDLRVWWIPQVPIKPFLCPVADLPQAALLIEALARYDAFQFENNIKPDYCNAGGLSVFEDGEWSDWSDEETGDDFREWLRGQGSTASREVSPA
ncbi:MAG: hypothetical protein JWM33_393 [Caulobacteraceae bacterium]|nr:hypothetical protein [Caulobacteraceae bacterium]